MTDVLSSGCWKGNPCFLVGGGPSLRDFNFEILNGKLTIGVNKAFLRCFCTVNYAMDIKFYNYVHYRRNNGSEDVNRLWKEYSGIKLFLSPDRKIPLFEDIYIINRIKEEHISLDMGAGIYAGTNSGFGALMLAVMLGANPVYLLGYDMRTIPENNVTHWHDGYPRQSPRNLQRKLDKFMEVFEKFAPQIKELGIEVINLCPDSKLDCFPKADIGSILKF
ncbi:MAG: hypothetical protein ACTSWQ_09935 [Candidatus Thorarchaeota archaeon]